MKNFILFMMTVAATISAIAQDATTTKAIAPDGFSFTNHLKSFSWVYVSVLFIALVGIFVTAYYFGWDKKLFKHKTGDDNNHMFI